MHFAAEEPPSAFVVVQSVMMMPAKPHSFLCSGCAQIVAVGGVDTVYLVVGGHDRLWLGFFDCNFEALQIDSRRARSETMPRYAAAVFFLIVAGVMFDGRSDPVPALDASCEGLPPFFRWTSGSPE